MTMKNLADGFVRQVARCGIAAFPMLRCGLVGDLAEYRR
jgi:hypothetical protein